MRVVVVGDVLLDEDIDGVATRLSPEAPVPVVDVSSRTRRAGCAGLVVTMLAQDGVNVESSPHSRSTTPRSPCATASAG